MQVRMEEQVLSPGVQQGREANLRTQTSGIGGKSQQGRRGRVEEQIIEATLIVQEQGMQQIGNREDDVEVRDGQQTL
jgi:hypothetical protein